ncbi:hypothetical protein [Haloarcula nitratireducens]|nr:hypothetical protein [Halomicroarcula nitratireducens]
MNERNAPIEARFDCRDRTATVPRHGRAVVERAWGFSGEVSGDRA